MSEPMSEAVATDGPDHERPSRPTNRPIRFGGMTPEERLDDIESTVKALLARRGYPQDWVVLTEKYTVTQMGDEIYDLCLGLFHLHMARWVLTTHRPQDAVHMVFLATKHAVRGNVNLFAKDERSRKASSRGKISGAAKRREASQAWPVLDAYLKRAANSSTDDTKTGLAKRAQRMLSRHCELWRQSESGDKLAEQRFVREAAPGLDDLLQDGWAPPQWRTLYPLPLSSLRHFG